MYVSSRMINFNTIDTTDDRSLYLFLGGMGVFFFRYSTSLSSLLPELSSSPIFLHPVTSSRFVFCVIFVLVFLSFRFHLRSIVSPVCLTCLLLARLHNIPLVALHLLAAKTAARLLSVSKLSSHPLFLTFFFYSCSQFAFFSQGTCNSLASVDVSASTVGLTEHHPVLSGLLMTFATYSLPLMWIVCLLEVGSKQDLLQVAVGEGDKDMLNQVCIALTWLD